MPYVDRTVFTSNDQSSGEVADPNLLESNDKHVADVVDANYKELYDFVNGKNISKLGIVNVKDYDAVGDGQTDETNFIQNAIDEVSQTGGGKVIFPPGTYKYTSITVKPNVWLVGMLEDVQGAGNRVGASSESSTVLYPTDLANPSIVLQGNASISGFCWYYKDQVWGITAESDSFKDYPATIQLGDANYNALGNTISNFLLIGVEKFIEQYSASSVVEKLKVSDGYGYVLDTFCKIIHSTDIPRFINVHLNPNSVQNLITGDKNIYRSKVARSMTMFKFARVDEVILENCFAFGLKHGVHLYVEGTESAKGGGITTIGTSFDAVHQAFKVEREHLDFGIKIMGGFFVPIVDVTGSEKAVISFDGTSQYTRVFIDNIRSFGNTNSALNSTSSPNYHFVYNTSGTNNVVFCEGYLANHATSIVQSESHTNDNIVNLIGTDGDSPHFVFKSVIEHVVKGLANNDHYGYKMETDAGIWRIAPFGASGSQKFRVLYKPSGGSEIELFRFLENGSIELLEANSGVTFKSPDGLTTKRLTVHNDGVPFFEDGRIVQRVLPPSTATDTGVPGQYADDGTYLYVCTGTNTWKRVALSSW